MTSPIAPPDAEPPRSPWRRLVDPRANPRRALILCGAGAVVGLLIAGFGLFTARGTASRIVPPEDVALVNQRPVLVTDYVAQLQTTFSTSLKDATRAQRRKVLDDMIREELYVQRGLELDMPSSDPDTRTALVAAVEQQVSVGASADAPGPAQLRAFYDAHRDKYSTAGRLLMRDLVPAAGGGDATARLQAAARALRTGQSADAVARAFGLRDSGKLEGEEFYFAAQIHLGQPLFDAARRLRDGESAAPVAAPDGPHLLVMIRNTPPLAESFETAEAEVAADYRRDREAAMQAGEERYLRRKAEILVRPEFR